VSILVSRSAYPGTWMIDHIESYNPGYSTCRIICKRRKDTQV
jgi:hypothetical protein